MEIKSNIRSFRPSEEFENLQHINQAQFVLIQGLQNENLKLKDLIKHLEQILLHKASLIEK